MNSIRSTRRIRVTSLLIVTVMLLVLLLMAIAEYLPQLSSVAWNNPI